MKRLLRPLGRPGYYSRLALQVARRMRRPVRTLARYASARGGEHVWQFRDGLRITTRRPAETQAMFSILFHDVYGSVGEGRTIIDIGANVGAFSLSVAHRQANTVYAFEPAPPNFELLERNVAANECVGKIFPIHRAVAGRRGRLRMLSDLGVVSRLLREGEEPPAGRRVDEVETLTLEDVFQGYGIEHCDLLKLDCEGSEHDLLRAAPDRVLERVAEIRMECDFVDAERNHRTMRDLLQRRGYDVVDRGYFGGSAGGQGIFFARRRAAP